MQDLDIQKIREQFPALQLSHKGKPLIYLDNAATTQKPRQVIDRLVKYYSTENSNVHRAAHRLSTTATQEFESARQTIADFINARRSEEIIYTSGATGAINLVAYSYGRSILSEGDEVIVSALEHHSNLVPWQSICQEKKAILKIAPIDENGEVIIDDYEALFTEKTKIVAFTHVSNTLGIINPIEKVLEIARNHGAKTLVDASQSVQHFPIDVQKLDCDFLVFSGHKIYGPTGIGVLYGKYALLAEMPPFLFGGEMISNVTYQSSEFNSPPYRYEAGTPNIAGAIGLGEAIKYLLSIGLENIAKYEKELYTYAEARLKEFDDVRIIGNTPNKSCSLSFVSDKLHHSDLATFLDLQNIAVRAGHHCTQPLVERFGLTGTVRASMVFYNTYEEIDVFVKSLRNILDKFGN
jgi:cysteine desulfurase / selenocysteine lyase